MLENSFCKKDVEGNKVYCASRKEYVLDCMCRNVIQGRYNKNFEFFSEKGSFWTNNTLGLAYSENDKEKLGAVRGNCKEYGYKSKALIPIRSRGEIVGLLQISDKREGLISKDRLGIIFDRFKQAHKSLSQKSEGSGIGLSLVKALVEMHDGNINVSSIVGKGTEFIIGLPVKVIEDKAEKIMEVESQSNIERIKVEFSDIYNLLD